MTRKPFSQMPIIKFNYTFKIVSVINPIQIPKPRNNLPDQGPPGLTAAWRPSERPPGAVATAAVQLQLALLVPATDYIVFQHEDDH
jgi:hypothetical protein